MPRLTQSQIKQLTQMLSFLRCPILDAPLMLDVTNFCVRAERGGSALRYPLSEPENHESLPLLSLLPSSATLEESN